MINVEDYEKAYAEVIEILNYIPMNEYRKIPKKYIVFMEENCSENSSFVYNIALPFDKQNISDIAKNILGMLFRLFIIDNSKKQEVSIKDQEIKDEYELEKYMRYGSNNLFENNNKIDNIIKESVTEEITITQYKESFFKKILKKILNIFKR